MDVASQRRVPFLFSIRLLLLWIHISLMGVTCSWGAFTLRDQEENEVIYVGETITLECRAPNNVSNPQFKLLDSQNNVLVDQGMFYIDGHYGYRDTFEKGVNFQISTASLNKSIYLCEISEGSNVISTEVIDLYVSPRRSPECFLNTSESITIGEVIGLSCYQEVGVVQNSDFRWKQILRDGTVKEQFQNPSRHSGLINLFKRKLSMNITASFDDDGSQFECVIIVSGSEYTCKTDVISIQAIEEVDLSILPTNVTSLDKGESQNFSCESSDPRQIASWRYDSGYQVTDVEVELLESNLLSVSIPKNTSLLNSDVLTFVCEITLDGNFQAKNLFVTIAFASGYNPPNNATMDSTMNVLSTTTKPTTSNVSIPPSSQTTPPTDTYVSYITTMSTKITRELQNEMNKVGKNESESKINDSSETVGSVFTIVFIIAGLVATVLVITIAILLICIYKTVAKDYE